MVTAIWRSALAVLVCGLAGCSNDVDDAVMVDADRVQTVTLSSINATSAPQLFAPHAGRITVVNLWASWCEPCRQEMPSLEALSRQGESLGVRVVGVNVDEDRHLALEYLRSHPLTFDQYWDPGMRSTSRAWRLAGVPTTLVIGPDGRLQARIVGSRDWNSERMRRLIFSAAKQPA